MQRIVKWILRIRDLGVASQDIETIRRLRTINVIILLSNALMLSYGAFYAAYDADHFFVEILYLAAVIVLFASILLLTRAGKAEPATWMLIGLALLHLAAISWLLGPSAGTLSYLLAAPIIFTLIIPARRRFMIWPIAIAVGVIFFGLSFGGRTGSVDSLPLVVQRVFFFVNVVGAILLACSVGLVFRWLIARAEADLAIEQSRSDRLLRAILPEAVATTLKVDDAGVVAQQFESITAVFADIVGFTKTSAHADPKSIVMALNAIFSSIDDLANARRIEKIKTIGDAYFAVCGLPDPVDDHAERVADFAIDLQREVATRAEAVWPGLRFRVALHTGPAVAGVIGRTKFAYDVWGDTINTAARLEDVCRPGETLLTDAVAKALPARFRIEPVGMVDLRDRGRLQTFRLLGYR